MDSINLIQKLTLIDQFWSPKIIGELNGQYLKLAKLKGEFVWHSHNNEDEFFLVIKGALKIELRDGAVLLNEGEYFVVPKGVEHKPSAQPEAHVLLIEPKSTKHTGEVDSELTVSIDDQHWEKK